MGWATLISTPNGRGWFYDLHTRGRDPQETDYASFHFASNTNPYFPAQEWDEARRTLPHDVFRQEYMAEFLEDSAGIGDPVYDDLCRVLPRIEPVKLTNLSKAQFIQRLIVMPAAANRLACRLVGADRRAQALRVPDHPERLDNLQRAQRLPRRLRHCARLGQFCSVSVQVDGRGEGVWGEAGGAWAEGWAEGAATMN